MRRRAMLRMLHDMNHTEHAYHEAGYRLERSTTTEHRLKLGKELRAMLSSETPDDQHRARQLIEQGRKEARR